MIYRLNLNSLLPLSDQSIKIAAQPNMEIVKEAIEVGEKVVDNLADQKEMEVESFSKSASAIRDFVLANMEDVTNFIRLNKNTLNFLN